MDNQPNQYRDLASEDPTSAVKEALTLAVKNIHDKIDNLETRVFDKFLTLDKATDLARDELTYKLTSMMETIEGMFAANKDLVDQLARANQTALTAALLTQEKSASETKSTTLDMLKQLQANFQIANLATNEKIDRLTSRLDLGDGRGMASATDRFESRSDMNSNRTHLNSTISVWISGAFLLLAAIVALIPHIIK